MRIGDDPFRGVVTPEASVARAPERSFGEVLHAERAANPRDLNVGARESLVHSLTTSAIRPADREAFQLADRANGLTESSGRATFSSLRTTAGPTARASFGVGQLTTGSHLDQLVRLTPEQLAALGVDPQELSRMRRRGGAAEAWYRLVVRGGSSERLAVRAGIDPAQLPRLRELANNNQWHAIATEFGARFGATTGLSSSSIVDMARTVLLTRARYRREFAAMYESMHDGPFVRGPGRGPLLAATARQFAEAHPEFRHILRSLGGNDSGAQSLGHYLSLPHVAENLHGWYTAAARGAVGVERFVAILEHIDTVTTRMRHLENVTKALAAMSRAEGLGGVEQARVVARISRCFHSLPANAREHFFVDGNLSQPRFEGTDQLLAGLDDFLRRYHFEYSDRRLSRHMDRVLGAGRSLA